MLNVQLTPFPVLESKNILIRRIIATDVPEIILLRGNPESMHFIPRPLCKTNEDALELIAKFDSMIDNNEGINWGIALKSDNKIIGLCSFHRISKENSRAEIGYMILPEFQRKGLVSEAIKVLLHFGFEIWNLHSVFAIIDPQNSASEMVLIRNGFLKEGHFRESEFYKNAFHDCVYFGILQSDYLANKRNQL